MSITDDFVFFFIIRDCYVFAVLTTHGNPPLAIGGPPVEAILNNQSLFPPVVTDAPPVVTGGIFFKKMNCELWKIVENYCFIIESEGYLNFQKFTSALKKFCSN